jgi:thioredoxin 1
MKEINQTEFNALVSESKIPVLIDFHAVWCGPCKVISPILTELSEEYADKVLFAKVDVDNNMDLALEHGVKQIPLIVIMIDGKIVAKRLGMANKKELTEFINKSINTEQ